MKNKKTLLNIGIILFIILATVLIAWPSNSQDTINIGGVFHLSGEASFWGTTELNAAQMAVEEINSQGGINNKKIKFIVEDSQTDFLQTNNVINKLIEVDQVSILVGPTWFGQVASPIAKEKKKLIISPSAGVVSIPSKYFFCLWPTESQETVPIADHIKKEGKKEILVVYSLIDWSQNIKNEFKKQANKNGLSIIKEFDTSPDEKDFRTIISSIKEINPDALYLPFAFYPSMGEFAKQAKTLGLKIPIYSTTGLENPFLLESYPEIEGTTYPWPKKRKQDELFNQKYLQKYGELPGPSGMYAYDTIKLIELALKNGKETPEEISEFLHKMKPYKGYSNTIQFSEDGRITEKEHIIKQVKNGKFVNIV